MEAKPRGTLTTFWEPSHLLQNACWTHYRFQWNIHLEALI